VVTLRILRLKYSETIYLLMRLIKVIQDGYDMVRVQEIDRLISIIENVMKEKKSIVVKVIN